MKASASDEPSPSWRAARDAANVGPHLADPWIAYRVAHGVAARFVTVATDELEAAAGGVVYLARPRFRPWIRPRASLDLLPRFTAAASAKLGADLAAAHTELARALIELARASGWARLEIESFDGPTPPPDLKTLGCATRERFEFLLDLAAPAEGRFAALKSSHRRKVRDAEKSGVTVADETGAAAVAILRELQGHTQERRTGRGEPMDAPDADRFRRLAEIFVARGGGALIVGRRDGRPLSAILCGVATRRAYYLIGGTSPEGFECNAATLVLWRASELLATRGVATLNLGGVPRDAEQPDHPEHGLFRFKEGFGAARVECCSGIWSRP